MDLKNLIFLLIFPSLLSIHFTALAQDQEVFLDFENAEGSGDFTLGEPPDDIRFIGFTVETLEDSSLLHSGSRALTLGPGQEGKIFTEKGIAEIEFYVAESTGAGKIEIRGRVDEDRRELVDIREDFFLSNPNGVVNGLPANISPGANPPLQRFVAFSGNFFDDTDLNFVYGMKEIKFVNVTGKLSIDDVGYTLINGPTNNTVYSDFNEFVDKDTGFDDFIVGASPYSATFSNGFAPSTPNFFGANDWLIQNGETGTITFETPAARVQFYASTIVETAQGQSDATIQVFDTEDNLLTTIGNLLTDIQPGDGALLYTLVANELGSGGGIARITLSDKVDVNPAFSRTRLSDFGFTPIGAPGEDNGFPPPTGPSIITQPKSQEVQAGTSVSVSVTANGDNLSYQWYLGDSGDTANPIIGATTSNLDKGEVNETSSCWVRVSQVSGGSVDSDTAVITVSTPVVPLVLEGTGDIAGESIQHPNGNVFDQILLTGDNIRLQARPGQITRVSFMDEDEDIVQVEFSGNGTFAVTLEAATFLLPALPPRYNQAVEYVTGRPSVVIDGADANTFFSIFTVGRINAVNQALFPEGQVYDAQADVTLVEVVNSTGMGGMQLSNTVFSGSTGKTGIDARGVPIAVRLTVGDIDASGDAVPHLLFGEGSFTVAAGNPGLRITGGDLVQTNGASVVVAESGSTTRGFDRLITQNNFKSDNTPQPTLSIDATFTNEDGDDITVEVDEVTIE